MNKFPEIRFQFSWLLDPIFRDLFRLDKKLSKLKYPSQGQIFSKVKIYERTWRKIDKKLLRVICDVLDLSFYQDIIDVYVVGRCAAFSDPMVIPSTNKPNFFIDELTHEIIHRILTDNTRKLDVAKIWSEMFPKEKKDTRNEILAHAVQEHIYRNILKKPQRLREDIKFCSSSPTHRRSWEVVRERGYMNIISDFKSRY